MAKHFGNMEIAGKLIVGLDSESNSYSFPVSTTGATSGQSLFLVEDNGKLHLEFQDIDNHVNLDLDILDSRFVNISGDTMTGDLVMENGSNVDIKSGDLKVEETTISSSNVVNVDSNTVLDTFPVADGNAAYWDVLIKDGTNYRASRVFAIWDDNGTDIKFSEVSTESIGDTGSLDMNASISSGMVRLKIVSVSSSWTIKFVRSLL